MPEEIGIVPAIIIIALSGLLSFAIPYYLMSRDDKTWERRVRRERRHRELEAKIDRKYRRLQREVHDEIRREIRNELRHELRYEIRREFEKLERRLGGRIDAAGPALIGSAGAAPWETESGPRNAR